MITLDADGRVTFTLDAPEANRVELVGAFDGWDERRIDMDRAQDGRWICTLMVRPGSYLFRYLIDGDRWIVDESAHGTQISQDGTLKSRVWLPPLEQDPDSIAA